MPWIVTLVFYLWLAGGLGWAAAYEHGSERELTVFGTGVILLLWPVFDLASAVGETVDAMKALRG